MQVRLGTLDSVFAGAQNREGRMERLEAGIGWPSHRPETILGVAVSPLRPSLIPLPPPDETSSPRLPSPLRSRAIAAAKLIPLLA